MKQKKNKNIVQLRGLSEKAIEDVDLTSRKVTGYFSAFGNIDSHDDMIMHGAFAKSIQERGVNATGNRRIAHLYQHDMFQPIGKLLELYEDSFGLRFVSEIVSTQKGDDVLTMYQEGVLREHSIGFNYVFDKMEWIDDESMNAGGYWEIREVKLFEGSTVTFGSNENTPYLGSAKALSREDAIQDLNEQYSKNLKILSIGKLSDDAHKAAEYQMRIIQKSLNELLTTPSIKAVKDTLKQEPKKEVHNQTFFECLMIEEQKKSNFFNNLIK